MQSSFSLSPVPLLAAGAAGHVVVEWLLALLGDEQAGARQD